MQKQEFVDRGCYYNAFGYDPNGRLASIAANLYGPTYVPGFDIKQFVGAPEAPRFGPPAPFQLRSLPHLTRGTWKPTRPPGAPSTKRNTHDEEGEGGKEYSDFLDPPATFVPSHYDALLPHKRKHKLELEEDGGGYETERVDEEEMLRSWKRRRSFPLPRHQTVTYTGPRPRPRFLRRRTVLTD